MKTKQSTNKKLQTQNKQQTRKAAHTQNKLKQKYKQQK
jgi:hypothetical protein